MTWRVVFEAAAQAEIVESFEWYEEKSYGLGGEFLRVIAAAEEQLARSPGSVSTDPATLPAYLASVISLRPAFRTVRRPNRLGSCLPASPPQSSALAG